MGQLGIGKLTANRILFFIYPFILQANQDIHTTKNTQLFFVIFESINSINLLKTVAP